MNVTRLILINENGHEIIGVISRPTSLLHSNANRFNTLNEVLQQIDIPVGRYQFIHVSPEGIKRKRTNSFDIITQEG